MQIYKTKPSRKGYSGFSADELTNRLNKVLVNEEASKGYGEFLNKNNTEEVKPESLTTQEWEDYQKTKMYERRNPLTGAKADDKFAIIQNEYKEALKIDQQNRKLRSEAIERQVVNHLKAMNIEPDYTYSKEIIYEEEGGDTN